MKKRKILSLLLGVTILGSAGLSYNFLQPNKELKAETPTVETEYYRMGSAYMEIQPFSKGGNPSTDKTYGMPVNAIKLIDYIGSGRNKETSTLKDRETWGNHGAYDGVKFTIPTHTPDGLEIEGVEWVKPLLPGTELPTGRLDDPFTQIRDYHQYKYIENGYKPQPFEVDFSENKVMLMQSEPTGALPVSWDSERSMQKPLKYSSRNFDTDFTYNPDTREVTVHYKNIDAKPPWMTKDNQYGQYWSMPDQLNELPLFDANEIKAHMYYGHGIVVPSNATPKQLRAMSKLCDIQKHTVNGVTETYCATGIEPTMQVNQYSNPARYDFGFVVELGDVNERFPNLSERDKEYYKQMPGGTARSNSISYDNWFDYWSSSYVVPSNGDTAEQTFAKIFNGDYDINQGSYRLYTPTLLKYKVKPSTNFLMHENTTAVYDRNVGGILKISPTALLENHTKDKENTYLKLEIINKSFPNQFLNEVVYYYGTQELTKGEPFRWTEQPQVAVADPNKEKYMKPIGENISYTAFQPKLIDKEQILTVRLTVNPNNKPEEENREDNVWEKDIRIPSNDVDLLVKELITEAPRATSDWKNVCIDVKYITEALNIDDPEFLAIHEASPVAVYYKAEGTDGYLKTDTIKDVHMFDDPIHSNTQTICLPNGSNRDGYNVTIRVVINPFKLAPPQEVTFENNYKEIEVFVPVMPPPAPPVKDKDIPDPDLILPWYNLEAFKCYLPHNPKTGQKAQILYDIGSYTHDHTPNWQSAKALAADGNFYSINPKSVTAVNWGRPTGWNTRDIQRQCPEEVDNAREIVQKYYEDNQMVSVFYWWDKEIFQQSRGSSTEPRTFENPTLKLTIQTVTHRNKEQCTSNCCTDWQGRSLHSHRTEKVSYTKSDGTKGTRNRRVCVGRSPAHYHSHQDYYIEEKLDTRLENNIKVFPGQNKTIDHATGKTITKSGYGVYSVGTFGYLTDNKEPKSCCSFDSEAYMFFPHLNKVRPTDPKRIVPMDKFNNNKPFPNSFRTAPNKGSISNHRKQFIDVDFPDGKFPINFRYKLRAPNFVPTKYPTDQQKKLISEYPTANPALGICDMGDISIKGNMWDDVWVHPDNPNSVHQR